MIKRKHGKIRFLIVLVAVVISVLAIIVSRQNVEKEVEIQIYSNLKDVAVQNEAMVESLLNSKQDLLFAIADEINDNNFSFDSEESIWGIVEWLKNYNNIYDFKRMGIIAVDGTAYTTEGYTAKLSDEPYQYGVQGIANISSTLTDAIGVAEPINVFSVPVFMEDGKTVKGILFATYCTENFKQLLSVDSFDGAGYSYIIRKDGSVIVDSDKSPAYGTKNVFDTMLSISDTNKELVSRVRMAMQNNQSGYEKFYAKSYRSMYYMPLNVDSINQTWYLLTMVPASVLEEKSEQLLVYQNGFIATIGIVIIVLVVYYAVTYRKDEELLRDIAYIDPLTNGNNMQAFNEQLRNRKINWGYMVSVDINDFKLVNSVCGIEKGNETIRRVWEIINANLGERDVAAHGGGDHYVMYVQEVYRDKLLERIRIIAEQIENLAEEIGTINLSPYFGFYEIQGNKDPEECYNYANQAKKLVKGNKNKKWAFYEEIDFQKMVDDRDLVDSFKSAIENDEFEIWYQPKYSGDDARMVGAEALVRWRKSDGTLIPPFRFIPLFESNGMIVSLDEHVFEKVCKQQKEWEAQGYKIFPVSVNISRASLYFRGVVDKYTEIVRASGLNPNMVPLEITESATVNNSEIQELVKKFRDVGFPLCLDDFGNGYSSLAMLNMIRFDVLKLDKSLVDYIEEKDGEKLVVYAIELAKSMGMSITAEGVETKNQVEFLKSLECDEIQGYYYSKPLPLDEFSKLLTC